MVWSSHVYAEVRDVRRNGGGAGCVGGQEKEWMRCFLDDLRAFGINADQWTTDCSPGRGGMVQNGKTRGGTFHGEMDRCRENQG